MNYFTKFKIFTLVLLLNFKISNTQYCDKDVKDCENQSRFILYDINPPEGFNLRRDVYMRYAVFARKITRSNLGSLNNFKLVLPPWSMLYHWKRRDEPEHIPWSVYFDLKSMRKFAPVIEMHEFFNEIGVHFGKVNIDEVYILQHYKEMFDTGNFKESMSVESCNEEIKTSYFYYENVTSENIKCLSFHGFTSQLIDVLKNSTSRTFLFDHAEVALHDRFGDEIYWKCRRSMRFNKDLISIAREFRKKFLNSTDEADKVILPDDWQDEKPRRTAKGGPYVAVHIRRRDFVWGRPKHVPDLKNAAEQIKNKLNSLGLKVVFVASDAPSKEIEELKSFLTPEFQLFKFKPNKEIKKTYKEGGIAIIEQIICSHAQFFLGTYESTFSFRIQEEREILGFPVSSTFNRLCGNEEKNNCDKTSKWTIQY